MAAVSIPEPFGAQLKRLRLDRKWGRSELSRRTVKTGDLGVADATIVALERKPERRPDDRTVLLLGEALGASDEEFPAYALAKARRLFDEYQLGQAEALRNLSRLDPALEAAAEAEAERGAAPASRQGQRPSTRKSATGRTGRGPSRGGA